MSFVGRMAYALGALVLGAKLAIAQPLFGESLPVSVRIGASGGHALLDFVGGKLDGSKIESRNSLAIQFQNNLTGQLDFNFQREDYDVAGVITNISGTVHANWRDPEKGMFGITGSFGHIDVTKGGGTAEYFRAGAEGELYFEKFTLSAGIGYVGLKTPETADGYYTRLGASTYLDDNFRLNADISIAEFDALGTDTVYASAGGEYLFANQPIAVTASWSGAFFDIPGIPRSDSHQFMGGIRLYFGAGSSKSLKQIDRTTFTNSCIMRGSTLSYC